MVERTRDPRRELAGRTPVRHALEAELAYRDADATGSGFNCGESTSRGIDIVKQAPPSLSDGV